MEIKLIYWRNYQGQLVQTPISNKEKQTSIKRSRILKNITPEFFAGLVAATYGVFSVDPEDNGLYIKIKDENKWMTIHGNDIFNTFLNNFMPFGIGDEKEIQKGDIIIEYYEEEQLFRVPEISRDEFIKGLAYFRKMVGDDSMIAEMY